MTNEIIILGCEDASHLGGPMGTEYTTPMWSKPFSTVEKAKKYAEDYVKKKFCKVDIDWRETVSSENEKYHAWDAMRYIFYIRFKQMDEVME